MTFLLVEGKATGRPSLLDDSQPVAPGDGSHCGNTSVTILIKPYCIYNDFLLCMRSMPAAETQPPAR